MTARSLSLVLASLLLFEPAIAHADAGAQCTMCLYSIKNSMTRLSALKSSGSMDENLTVQVLKDTCGKLDGTPRDMCGEIVVAHGKSFARSLREGETPEESCRRAGMCLAGH